jgi:hypothetical protein
MRALSLGVALARGAVVALANWQVVLVDFAVESFYKLLLAVPVIGGAAMVTAVVGTDPGSLVAGGIRATADLVVASLVTAPVALLSFLAAVGLVALAGEVLMFALKSGTLAVVLAGERAAPDPTTTPFLTDSFSAASVFSLEAVYHGVGRFWRRAVTMALGLAVAYFLIAGSYLTVLAYALPGSAGMPAWPLVVFLSTSAAVVATAGINLGYDLLRVVVVSDDCGVRVAARRLRVFVIEDARQVMGIFAVVLGTVLVATAGSLLAAGGLGLVAVVPVLSLVTAPLQLAAWILRGLLFQFFSLAALGAYAAQYRRFSAIRGFANRADADPLTATAD